MEEVLSPKVSDFVNSTDNGYSKTAIVQMEKKITNSSNWMMTPPTLFMWASWYMTQWDLFISDSNSENKPLFKTPSQDSYSQF